MIQFSHFRLQNAIQSKRESRYTNNSRSSRCVSKFAKSFATLGKRLSEHQTPLGTSNNTSILASNSEEIVYIRVRVPISEKGEETIAAKLKLGFVESLSLSKHVSHRPDLHSIGRRVQQQAALTRLVTGN